MESNKMWQELNLESFKDNIQENKNKNVVISVYSIIKTTITVYHCQLLINDLSLIIADDKEFEFAVDIDPLPKIFMYCNKKIFKIKNSYYGEVILNFC